ncbi:hypothetical protein OF122_12270 [Pelagibacterium flavum]|uniref:Peptidase M41 domain-containing protein n=1 Tax=Pelagibacterium flavum TaxID=2984530 RepID=A0ABY6IJU2_9HYPH|nr:hypothetical protein [Pelagibacterium sp. YIM 151497]UYQ70838.1 hypothetical protein OF122_12270 [Pelagibacterium sp. YIM 151497]
MMQDGLFGWLTTTDGLQSLDPVLNGLRFSDHLANELDRAMSTARTLVENHRDDILELADLLIAKKVVTGHEVMAIGQHRTEPVQTRGEDKLGLDARTGPG